MGVTVNYKCSLSLNMVSVSFRDPTETNKIIRNLIFKGID